MKKTKTKAAPRQLPKLKQSIILDIKQYLKINKSEVLRLKIIDQNTKIAGEFFDDFLGNRATVYMPIDLKDILNLCLEEPNIIAEISRTRSSEASTLTIIKDAIRFYLKDYVYQKMSGLIEEMRKS